MLKGIRNTCFHSQGPQNPDEHVLCRAQAQRLKDPDLVRGHGDDGGEGEDERVDIGHVEVVGCDSVGHGVSRHRLRRLCCKTHHVLRVHLDGVVAQLGLGDSLQGLQVLAFVFNVQNMKILIWRFGVQDLSLGWHGMT